MQATPNPHPQPGLCPSPPTCCPRRGEGWGRVLAFPAQRRPSLCVSWLLLRSWLPFRHVGDGWGEGQAFQTSGDDQCLVQLRPLWKENYRDGRQDDTPPSQEISCLRRADSGGRILTFLCALGHLWLWFPDRTARSAVLGDGLVQELPKGGDPCLFRALPSPSWQMAPFFFLKMYLFFGCTGSSLLRRLSLKALRLSLVVARGGGYSFFALHQLLGCSGFSRCKAQAPSSQASVVVVCRLSSGGSRGIKLRLSRCGPQASLLWGRGEPPRPEMEPVSPWISRWVSHLLYHQESVAPFLPGVDFSSVYSWWPNGRGWNSAPYLSRSEAEDLHWLHGCRCLGKGLSEEGQGSSENSCFFLSGFKPSTRERGSLLKWHTPLPSTENRSVWTLSSGMDTFVWQWSAISVDFCYQ